MPYRRAIRALWSAAAVLWAVAIVLAILRDDSDLRSLSQGIAGTATVAGLILWAMGRESRRVGRTAAARATARVRAGAPLDMEQITIEIPRPRRPVTAPPMQVSRSTIPAAVMAQVYRLGASAASRPGRRSL
jgi:hypothetical protein